MGTSLTGTKIRDTYDALIKVSDNGALDGTLQVLTDGLGNNSALSLSTAGASVGGTLAVSGAATFSGGVSGNVAFDTNTLFVDASNNGVGIGTTSILGDFSINNASEMSAYFFVAGTRYAGLYTDGSIFSVNTYNSAELTFSTSTGTSFAERMRINSGGDISFRDSSANEAFYWDASAASLGIGTTTPSSKVQILDETPILRIQGLGSGEFGLKITDANASLAGITYNSTTGEQRIHGAESYVFQTIYAGGSERMRITSGGDVLIGSTASVAKLDITPVATGGALAIRNSSGVVRCFTLPDATYGYVNVVSVPADGFNAFRFENSANVGVGSITINASSTAYNTSSDYRLKEDWQPMEGALDRVDALKPINFAWKSNGSRVDGFLAHELAEVVPEAVTGEKDAVQIQNVEVSAAVLDEEGNVITEAVYEEQEVPVYQGIDQSKIVPLLVAAIQELKAKVESLEAQLNA